MWRNKLLSDKAWSDFNNLFAEEYHDLHKLQYINTTQAGFHLANTEIIMQEDISKSIENIMLNWVPCAQSWIKYDYLKL